MSSIKRRLADLEWSLRLSESEFLRHQRELCCPLPPDVSDDEFQTALAMLTAAHAALQVDIAHVQPLENFREFAASLHEKYQEADQ